MSQIKERRISAVCVLALLVVIGSPQQANAAAFIEVEGRFITIFGRTFCMFNCEQIAALKPIVKQPAIQPPKLR